MTTQLLYRPKQAAEALGIGLSTFWELAKNDKRFPSLIKLGPRVTAVRAADLAAYVERCATDTGGAR